MAIYNNLTELIGNTPLVRLNKLTEGLKAEVIVKLESFNPFSSVKDRIGFALIEDAEKQGLLNSDSVIIEPTSGNTGIALAFISAVKGYRVILTMPDTMSIERRKLLKSLGAELVLTPGAQGMNGAILRSEELARQYPNSFIPGQFKNPANPDFHFHTTAEEIWKDTGGELDIFVAGVGTGGTISGVGRGLKKHRADIKIVAVEPDSSPVISGGSPGPHKIQGIGAGFIPTNLDTSVIDNIIRVTDSEAGETARRLAKNEGILAGISSGAALSAALKLADQDGNEGKRIVVLLPDTGERYLSTWLFEE